MEVEVRDVNMVREYFSSDADMLPKIKKGDVLLVYFDAPSKKAQWSLNGETYNDDDFDGVAEFLVWLFKQPGGWELRETYWREILNLTQHSPTVEQIKAGVVEPSPATKLAIKQFMTFSELPTADVIKARAKTLAEIAWNITEFNQKVMIGGAPYLMAPLEEEIMKRHRIPVYAFSRRVVQEFHRSDGTVEKKMVFKFEGFVEVNEDGE